MATKKKAKTVKPRQTNDNDRKIGEKVRERRREIGMSQGELGGALHMSFQQIQKYEQGTNRVAASTLIDIAHTLGVTTGYFLDDLKPIKR